MTSENLKKKMSLLDLPYNVEIYTTIAHTNYIPQIYVVNKVLKPSKSMKNCRKTGILVLKCKILAIPALKPQTFV